MRPFSFDIDTGGACNLRCPSCAQGNVREHRLPHAFMAPELLAKIIAKAKSECLLTRVNLFVWSEPLLHPRLPELIRVVQEAGVACHLSSNLNLLPDADAIMAADPASFKVSVSGFTQQSYGFTHRGGDIERVKTHLLELVAAKQRARAKTRIYVNFHRYRHNLREELPLREWLAGIGVDFEPIWAQMLPLEKVLGVLGAGDFDFPLTEEDHRLIDHLALPLRQTLEMAQHYRHQPCPLRDRQFSIDCQGNVQLCCGGFDNRRFTVGNFLALSLAQIQRRREEHPICGLCMHHGAHVYMTFGAPEMDHLALANIPPEEAKRLGQELRGKRLRQRLDRWYRKSPLTLPPGGEAAVLNQLHRLHRLAARVRHGWPGRTGRKPS
ncbi:MAG: hypothetical protein IH614_03000 [Desulfuromonadales bacterium]|nr:hypothetical protein [Desulfuromonadales bacterium]